MSPHVHRLAPAAPDDAALLAELHAGSFPAPWDMSDFATLLTQPGINGWLIYSDESDIAGFILVRRAADEAEILTLAVNPAARRQGLGRELVEEATHSLSARGVRQLFLEVATSNTPAKNLYRGCGFIVCGKRPHYYAAHAAHGGSTDAIVMKRDL